MQAVITTNSDISGLHPIASHSRRMVRLFDKPTIEYTIELLKTHGITDIIISVQSNAQEMLDYFGGGSRFGINIQYVIEDLPRGNAGMLRTIQPVLNDTFIVIPGNLVTDINLTSAIEFHNRKSSLATMITRWTENPSGLRTIQSRDDSKVTHYYEKSDNLTSNQADTGIYIFEPEILSYVPYGYQQDFGSDVFPRLIQNQEPIFACELKGYCSNLENLAQYRNVHFDALFGRIKLNLPATCITSGIWVGKDVDIHPTVELITPFYIGNGVKISRKASLAKFAVVGDLSLVDEEARIVQSILNNGTSIGRRSQAYGSILGPFYKLPDGGCVVDEAVVDDGSSMGTREHINSEFLCQRLSSVRIFSWSGLEVATMAAA